MISALFSLRHVPRTLESLATAYFRHHAEARRAEIILARLGLAWRASVLDEENIAVMKQLYWRYLIKDNLKVKENINNNLSNSILLLHLFITGLIKYS